MFLKKFISVLVVLTLFLLGSCKAHENDAFTPQTALEAEMEYVSDEFCFCASISCRSYTDISLTVTSPELLAGMKISATERGILAVENGTEYNFTEDKLGDRQGLCFAVFALRRFLYNNCTYYETADGFAAREETPYGTLTGIYSADGRLKSVSGENIGIVLN